MSAKQRIDDQLAFVLHTYPYSETSLIVDVFSREHGRQPLLARGARRPRSAMRGTLMSFQPLELGWFGSGEVKTLAKAEWLGGMPLLAGRCLLLGYYLNELLVSLLPREDAHVLLFDSYHAALMALSHGAEDAPELRKFEQRLLRELGYGLTLDVDAESGEAIHPEASYEYQVERGPIRKLSPGDTASPLGTASMSDSVSGKTLLDMVADDYSDPRTRFESRRIMRQLISHHLGGRVLQSRRVFMELQSYD